MSEKELILIKDPKKNLSNRIKGALSKENTKLPNDMPK